MRYASSLRADASLLLSHRRGAAGDVVTVVGVGTWPLLEDSHGHHERVVATVGRVDALPRHPSSSAVHRVNAPSDGPRDGAADAAAPNSAGSRWNVELALPAALTAGEHAVELHLDRIWHDEADVHGAVALDDAPSATVTVMPAVRELRGAGRGERDTRMLRIFGSGFSRIPAENHVRIGRGRTCAVASATHTEIVCEVAGGKAGGEAGGESGGEAGGGGDALAPGGALEEGSSGLRMALEGGTPGPGVVLEEIALRHDDDECVESLRAAADAARCALPNVRARTVHLRQQLVFPHATVERHATETAGAHHSGPHGEHLHERPNGYVLVRAATWLYPPADGVYAFHAELPHAEQRGVPCALYLAPTPASDGGEAAAEHAEPMMKAGQGACSSGAVRLERGRRYRFALTAVLGGHEQLAVRATVVPSVPPVAHARRHASYATAADHAYRFAAAPAEWFEARPSTSLAAAAAASGVRDVVAVHVRGLRAYCRAPDECRYSEAPSVDEDAPPRRATVHDGAVRALLNATWSAPPSPPPPSARHEVAEEGPTAAAEAQVGHEVLKLPLLPMLGANAADGRRRLQSTCGVDSCCVVLYRGARGAMCDAVRRPLAGCGT